MLLVENGEVFAPDPLGRRSILIASGRVEAIGVDGAALARAGVDVETIDATGCIAMPGLIDPHAHLIGGSGEKGFASQTPEISASELLRAGVTTVVGTIGADTTTRAMPALLAKVKALRGEGLSAFAWTGGYDARTLMSSIRDDIVLIDEIIGAGELAVADVRGQQYSAAELARFAAECYVAGTLTGKAGLLHLHVGDGNDRLKIVRDVLEQFDVKPDALYPTHVERSERLMREAIDLAKRGMPVDVDVYDEDLSRWLRFYRDHDGDPSLLTASSDAAINSPHTLFEQLMACVREKVASFDEVIAIATSNTARVLKSDAGELARGRIGHVLLIDAASYELRTVICAGRVVMRDGALVIGEQFLSESNRSIALRGEKVKS
ncbi:MAG TPA: amidohydrolase family protein [Thermoanaerobaculia bacterium]|jgi:beta-aspartyl-dipeptidase (metallo-type)|nr:amidohydrolase family protein [Thermoanaerobaculia bacterium]